MSDRDLAEALACMRLILLASIGLTAPAFAADGAPPQASPSAPAATSTGSATAAGTQADTAPVPAGGGLTTRWRIVPSLSVSETFTDNVALAPDDRRRSDLISIFSPAIRIEGSSARARLNLNYRPQQILYANQSSRNTLRHYLSLDGQLETLEDWLFVDVAGSMSQRSISAFGAQPTEAGNVNPNQVQTSDFRISPFIRGQLLGTADYELRHRLTATRASGGGSQLARADVSEWLGNLRSRTAGALFGWRIDAQDQTVDRAGARNLERTHVRGTLLYHPDPELTLSLNAGRESHTHLSADKQHYNTYGLGVQWVPSPRTTFDARWEKRFFGNAHNVAATHRTPRTAWRFASTKTATILPTQLLTASRGTAFDLLFDALTSRIPDPLARAAEVERLLREGNIPPDLNIFSTFLTNSSFVQRTHQASFAILGVRNTITFTASLGSNRALQTATLGIDSFAQSSEIDVRTIAADWAHRLSGFSSFNVLVSQSHVTGDVSNLESTNTSFRAVISTRIGARTTGSLGARYVRFDSTAAPGYREKAVTATLTTTFY